MKNIDEKIKNLFQINVIKKNNVFIFSDKPTFDNQKQTNDVFSDKWDKYDKENLKNKETLFRFQKKWYLNLYSFSNEQNLQLYLSDKKVILDAGCGLGYKAKWFADLSPNSLVIAMDYSDSVFLAAKNYFDTPNLVFVKNDIANTNIKSCSIDYISCNQVIHHTENPQKTMMELSRILKPGSELAVYVYAKKSLPRELIDDYFRDKCKTVSKDEMWKLSQQLTELGKRLSDLKINIDIPEIPLLGIQGGKMDLQRFIYWNFLKCFWNDELSRQTSIAINYDWYSPSNAFRYSKNEFEKLVSNANFKVRQFHSEEACYSGRFVKK